MKIKAIDRNTIILILLGICLFVYTCLRAAKLSMTHDESSTFINSIDINLWACFFSSECWGTANIHWLNSFLMQISVGLFGTDEFFIRLPNLLAHLLYLSYSVLLLRSFSGRIWLMLGGFMIFNANPYLLEFFALARGYGMGCGFVMMSVYHLYAYLDRKKGRQLALSFLGSILAVLSNFTFLNYFAVHLAFLGALSILALMKWDEKLPLLDAQSLGARPCLPLAVGGASSVFLAIILYYPIKFLRSLGEFQYGIDSLWVSYRGLVEDSNMGQKFLGPKSIEILMWFFGLLFLAAMLYGLSRIWKKGFGATRIFYFASCSLALLFMLALLTQYWLFDTKYLIHRTALIIIPIAAFPVYMFLEEVIKSRVSIALSISLLLAGYSVYHFSQVANLGGSREWYYDAETRNMIDLMMEKEVAGKKIKLGVYWIYHPTSAFYQKVRGLDFIEPIPYEKQLRSDSLYDYYFVEPGQGEQINSAYELEQKVGWVGALYKRKEINQQD